MQKILLSAYSCGPNRGSEPGVGWNAAVAMAKHAEIHVLTSFEFKELIEEKAFTFDNNSADFYITETVGGKVRVMLNSNGIYYIGHEESGTRVLYYEIYSVAGIKKLEETFIPTFSIDDIDEILGGCVFEKPVCYTVRIDENNSNPLTCCEYLDDAAGME